MGVDALRANPVRTLFWGLLCFSILMLFVAWGGIGELFIPPTSGPGTPLIDMPPPLQAFAATMCALPILALVLIVAGIGGMMRTIPKVGPRLVWRIGKTYITALTVVGLMIVAAILLFVGMLGIVLLEIAGSSLDPAVGLAVGLVFTAIPIALGWYLILVSGWSLLPLARLRERTAVEAAVLWAGACAALHIGADIVATLAMGSAALRSDAAIPARVPVADAVSAAGGFAALVVLTVVARRASRRYDDATKRTPAAQPA